MALQSRGQRRKSNGTGGIFEGDQDILSTRNFINGVDEGLFSALLYLLPVLNAN